MADLTRQFVTYEPLRTNRWVIKMDGVPEWLFRNFKIRNQEVTVEKKRGREDKKMYLKLDLSFNHAICEKIDFDKVLNCKNIKISFLDPVGTEVDYYDMKVALDDIDLSGDYSVDDILTTKCSFWIDDLSTMSSDNEEKETLENYLKNKEATQ